MSEKIQITALESQPEAVKVSTQRSLGAEALGDLGTFQIPVTSEEGVNGELVFNNLATGEEVYRGEPEEAADAEVAA